MLIKKRIFKCFGVLLVLFTISLFTLSHFSDTNALQHTYQSINAMGMCIPHPLFNNETSRYEFDWDTSDMDCYGATAPFLFYQDGDAYEADYSSSQSIRKSASYMSVSFNNDRCEYGGSINPIFDLDIQNSGFHFGVNGSFPIYHPLYTNLQGNAKCKTFNQFGTSGTPIFAEDTLPSGLLSCGLGNGAVCGGLWNTSEYIKENVLPYYFSFSGIYLQDKYIDTDGFHYSNSFSFDDLLTKPVHQFSKLQIPLWTYDNFFVDSDNFWQGRELEFKGAFEFDGSFAWHDNINSNGSSWKLYLSGFRQDSGDPYETSIDCTTNLITLSDLTRLEYSCPIQLEYSLTNIFPSILIDGNNQYVFTTDDSWRFSYTFLTTDHDDTQGETFGTVVVGANTWAGSAKSEAENSSNNSIIIDGKNFTSSLVNLFGFTFLNPFAPIFSLFNNQDSCVNIPIIAGMIHSDSTQVCPWFPSTVRNIATPVLGISSMMLIFGFAVRWLKSSSGNLFEDSAGVDTDSHHFGNKYRRKK